MLLPKVVILCFHSNAEVGWFNILEGSDFAAWAKVKKLSKDGMVSAIDCLISRSTVVKSKSLTKSTWTGPFSKQ